MYTSNLHQTLLDEAIDNALSLHQSGRLAEAVIAYRRLISIKPDNAALYINLGNVCYQLDQHAEAEAAYKRANAIESQNAMIHFNLGNLYFSQGRWDEAQHAYRHALALNPQYSLAHNNLGTLLFDAGRFEEAAQAYRQAIASKPDDAEAYSNLGNTLVKLRCLDEAEAAFKNAIAIKSDFAEAYCNLGNLFMTTARLDEALAVLRKSIDITPDLSIAHSNIMLIYQYLFSITHKEAFAEACNFGKHFEQPFKDSWGNYKNSKVVCRKLKVGFISEDFRCHPVGYFLENILKYLVEENIELYAYANTLIFDSLSERIKPYFHKWAVVKRMNDEMLDAYIRNDKIDILVDLAGHTSGNRITLFARKPAPVQVTWLGYPNTTGLHAIDYILADPTTAPPGAEAFYTERIWRIPETYICFTPPDVDVTAGPLPALENNYIVFGSFNNPIKINDTVISCWAGILKKVTNSVLLLKNGHFASDAIQKSLLQRFMAFGVDAARIKFEVASSRDDVIFSYRDVDIALDTFPYAGTTTTCEAAWMGVPTLTLKMTRGIYSHSGELIMGSLGLPEWVSVTVEEYIEKAVRFAEDIYGIAQIRSGLRQRLLASTLCNSQRYARNLEAAFRGMWQNWCAAQPLSDGNSLEVPASSRKLHIGGTLRVDGWEIFSIKNESYVDHVGNANDLSRFSDNTFTVIYASHVLEHLDYMGELVKTLQEWRRVMAPGGILMVSVPDMDVLARLYLDKERQNIEDRFLLMRMIFGGHVDKHDYHYAGLNEELLSHCLRKAGFEYFKRVADFGIFEDSSIIRFKGEFISLNMVACK